ncbi:MAG: ABC transporter ATP-binding protein [Ruminiclostridium sp.]|nr:ABC transporter ATP-binding protein [Ruminiclostridium sp.]
MHQIILKNVSKKFTTKTLGSVTAVDHFNLSVEEGECFSFLGPSGCGKTTTLRMIAGFEDLSEGEIYLGGKPVSIKEKNIYIPPEERGLGMVFQAFAVWPHMNVFENVAFPLKVKKVNKSEIKRLTQIVLRHTNLEGLEGVYPSELSGGQQQRIALARAIVTSPRILLLDEPLSNLDPKLRESMRFEIKELQKKFNFTILFVTHDQSEAMALSHRMLVMDMGRIIQVDTPANLYNKPVNRFVHNFLGQSSFLRVEIRDGKAYPKGDLSQELPCNTEKATRPEMLLAVRPNEIHLNRLKGYRTKIEKRMILTDNIEYFVRIGDQTLKIETPHRIEFQQGEPCCVDLIHSIWYEDDGIDLEAERNKRQLI